MSVVNSIAVGLPIALGVVMIGAGGVNFAGPASVRASTLGLSGRLSQGDGGARSRGGFASADPGNLTGWIVSGKFCKMAGGEVVMAKW